MTKTNIEGKSLLDTYLSYHNLVIQSKTKDAKADGMVFMPMLLMDAINILYEEYIAPQPFKHAEKRIRSLWKESYNKFNKDFFRAFNDEQCCAICDIMNDFDEYIQSDITLLRLALTKNFKSCDEQTSTTISVILACNALAQCAQTIWSTIRQRSNRDINMVEVWTQKLLNEYGDKRLAKGELVDINQCQITSDLVKQTCNHIVDFAQRLAV